MWPLNAKKIYEIITGMKCDNKSFENIMIEGISIDSRSISKNQIFVAIKGDNFDGHNYLKQCFQNNIEVALVQKNSSILEKLQEDEKLRCICVENVIDSLRILAKYMRTKFSFPVFGIGGSNGKTTTKEILYSMLLGKYCKVTKTQKSENGFLGLALTLLQQEHNLNSLPSALVLEIGIDDIGAMEKHIDVAAPDIVLLTALGPEHLDGLKTWDNAVKEEFILFSSKNAERIWQLNDEKIYKFYLEYLQKKYELNKDFIVIEKSNYNDYLIDVKNFSQNRCQNEIIWNYNDQNKFRNEIEIEINLHSFLDLKKFEFVLDMPGKHNAANFALAFGSAICHGLNSEQISRGLKFFIPPPMRSNLITLSNEVYMLNDVYNSSPLSVKAALDILKDPLFFDKPKLVVLGDMLELGDESIYWHESLVTLLKTVKHAHLCLYGSAMYSCYKLLQKMKDLLFNENNTVLHWFDSNKNPSDFLNEIDPKLNFNLILVKGSRGMKLERFVKVIEEKYKSF